MGEAQVVFKDMEYNLIPVLSNFGILQLVIHYNRSTNLRLSLEEKHKFVNKNDEIISPQGCRKNGRTCTAHLKTLRLKVFKAAVQNNHRNFQ